jgi:hypothetical protein
MLRYLVNDRQRLSLLLQPFEINSKRILVARSNRLGDGLVDFLICCDSHMNVV